MFFEEVGCQWWRVESCCLCDGNDYLWVVAWISSFRVVFCYQLQGTCLNTLTTGVGLGSIAFYQTVDEQIEARKELKFFVIRSMTEAVNSSLHQQACQFAVSLKNGIDHCIHAFHFLDWMVTHRIWILNGSKKIFMNDSTRYWWWWWFWGHWISQWFQWGIRLRDDLIRLYAKKLVVIRWMIFSIWSVSLFRVEVCCREWVTM